MWITVVNSYKIMYDYLKGKGTLTQYAKFHWLFLGQNRPRQGNRTFYENFQRKDGDL